MLCILDAKLRFANNAKVSGVLTLSLRDIEEAVINCRKCSLHESRKNAVPGDGDANADIMLIGEAPGRSEDMQGKPFVGAAGKILDECLESMGIARDEVYITNILKCRPPGNRNPEKDEIVKCTPYLDEQIMRISPNMIITLGNFSTRYILEKYGIKAAGSISKLHGKVFKMNSLSGMVRIIPMYHPAAAAYNPGLKDVILEDFRHVSGDC